MTKFQQNPQTVLGRVAEEAAASVLIDSGRRGIGFISSADWNGNIPEKYRPGYWYLNKISEKDKEILKNLTSDQARNMRFLFE